jgi:hypothetical protein
MAASTVALESRISAEQSPQDYLAKFADTGVGGAAKRCASERCETRHSAGTRELARNESRDADAIGCERGHRSPGHSRGRQWDKVTLVERARRGDGDAFAEPVLDGP